MYAKKRLGQHFLTSTHIAERIAAAVPAGADDHVVEIGPGRGALSVHLVKRFPRLHLVEIDRDVIGPLTVKLGSGAWVLHQEDVLAFDFARVGFPLHVVGNLPYGIAALILHKTLRAGPGIASCTFMVQREVANRILARPGDGEYGYLSVFCQFYGEPKLVVRAPAGAFFPRPEVDSAVVQIALTPESSRLIPSAREPDFFAMVEKAFQQRRKTLVNALSRGEDKDAWAGRIERAGLDPGARPQTVSVGAWAALFREADA